MREITADEAAVAVKRGAPLMKFCRRSSPHVVFAQCTSTALTYAGRRGRERSIEFSRVERVLKGRHTEVFRKRRARDAEDGLKSFSIAYADAGGAVTRTWDCVCESEFERDAWVLGIENLAREARGVRGGVMGAEANARARAGGDATDGMGAAVTVARAIGKFKRGGRVRESSVGGRDETPSERVMGRDSSEPNEAYRWGWLADATPAGAAESTSGGGFVVGSERWRRVDEPSAIEGMNTLDVVEIALGSRHALLRTRAGAVYALGEGKGGKLGLPSGRDAPSPARVDVDGVAIALACGTAHSIAIVRDAKSRASTADGGGDARAWGDANAAPGLLGRPDARGVSWFPTTVSFDDVFALGARSPRSSSLAGVKVVQVSCGPCHTACVSETGACYTWGEGSFHALGHGDRESQRAPRVLDAFATDGRVVLRVSCGVWHTAAVVAPRRREPSRVVVASSDIDGDLDVLDGEVFTWGDGESGQLGVGDAETASTPTLASGQIGQPGSEVCHVSCGQHHTVALTSKGDLWLAGCVGRVDNSTRSTVFTRLTDFETGSVSAVESGDNHVVVAARDGRVYSWGVGKRGRLGLGKNDRDQPSPVEIESLRGRRVLAIACGPTSSACVVQAVRMTAKEKAAAARRQSTRAASEFARRASRGDQRATAMDERRSSHVDTGSTSSYSAMRDRSGTGTSAGTGPAAHSKRTTEKMTRRLMTVLSPTFEGVAKTSIGSAKRESSGDLVAREERAPASETRAATATKTLDFAKETSTPKPTPSSPKPSVPVEPSKPSVPVEPSKPKPTPPPAEPSEPTESFIERARRIADEAETQISRLADEDAVLERATRDAIAERATRKRTAQTTRTTQTTSHASPREFTAIGPPREWVEEVENGVFMTLATDGPRTLLKRVRFSKRIFSNELAKQWWEENRARVIRELHLTVPA